MRLMKSSPSYNLKIYNYIIKEYSCKAKLVNKIQAKGEKRGEKQLQAGKVKQSYILLMMALMLKMMSMMVTVHVI